MATRASGTKQSQTTSTEVVAPTDRFKALVAKDETPLAEVIRAATTDLEIKRRAKAELDVTKRLPAPKGDLGLSDSAVAVIDRAMTLARNAPTVPEKPVELAEAQRVEHTTYWLALKAAVAELDKRIDIERTILLNDHTLRGEREGDVTDETPRDKDGFAVLDGEFVVGDEKLSIEKKSGSHQFTAEHLESMMDEGEITRKEYLDATEQVRVLNKSGFYRLMRKRPTLMGTVARLAKSSKSSISLHRRAA